MRIRIIILLPICLLAFVMVNTGAAEMWERHFNFNGGPFQICGGSCVLIPLVIVIAIWAAIIAGIIYFIRWVLAAGKRTGTPQEETALDVLKKRYARGEISREEFERMKQDIA